MENLILYFVKIRQTEPLELKSTKKIKCKKYGPLRGGWWLRGRWKMVIVNQCMEINQTDSTPSYIYSSLFKVFPFFQDH